MAFLFDTDAISEALRRQPLPDYMRWLSQVPRSDQFTSSICIGELFKGAYRASDSARHLENIEKRVLPSITVLPYDVAVARVYGEIHATLISKGRPLMDADLQIAATAIHHDLVLVTGNLQHFERIPQLRIERALVEAREGLSR